MLRVSEWNGWRWALVTTRALQYGGWKNETESCVCTILAHRVRFAYCPPCCTNRAFSQNVNRVGVACTPERVQCLGCDRFRKGRRFKAEISLPGPSCPQAHVGVEQKYFRRTSDVGVTKGQFFLCGGAFKPTPQDMNVYDCRFCPSYRAYGESVLLFLVGVQHVCIYMYLLYVCTSPLTCFLLQ